MSLQIAKIKLYKESHLNSIIKKETCRIPQISSKPFVGLDNLNTPNKSTYEEKQINSFMNKNNRVFQSKEFETFLNVVQELFALNEKENPVIKLDELEKKDSFSFQRKSNQSDEVIPFNHNFSDKILLKMSNYYPNYEKSEDIISDDECSINCQNMLRDYSIKNLAKINH